MRLKVRKQTPATQGFFKFQFQTGAIKSALRGWLDQQARAWFQFQTGAIKSPVDKEERDARIRGFNSKLVRLKVNRFGCGVHVGAMFQFQTGAIKRRFDAEKHPRLVGFNSKLVRLKAASYLEMLAYCDKSFNSKLVRLKGGECLEMAAWYDCFNSKLVRLKVAEVNHLKWFSDVSIPNWCD